MFHWLGLYPPLLLSPTSRREVVNICLFLSLRLPGSDWVDPEDPNVIAENELLSAANAIEAAAKKLSQLRPRQKARVGPARRTIILS